MASGNAKALLKSGMIAAVVLLLLAGLFQYWSDHSKPNEAIGHLAAIEQMETNGAPDIKAKDLDGNAFALSSLRGKVVIVNFWASWCGPCVQEVPSLIELVESMKGDLELVAVSGDSTRADIDAFLKSFPKMRGAHIHLLWDEDHSIMKSYGEERLPESFLLGPHGKLAKKIVGGIEWHTKDSEAYVRQVLAGSQ